jgi:hypothetical protein
MHHPEISTHPNHLHDGHETNILSSTPMNIATVLSIVSTTK